jgi:hypothetical protein
MYAACFALSRLIVVSLKIEMITFLVIGYFFGLVNMGVEPELLRVPQHFQSVEAVLETAKKMNLPNVLVISEREDGSLVFLETDMTVAEANWLLDRLKMVLLVPNSHERTER